MPRRSRTQRRVIRQGQRRCRSGARSPVRLQPRRVHAVQRRAAHQPDDAQHFPPRPVCASLTPAQITDLPRCRTAISLPAATERGFIHQCTDAEALDAALRAEPVAAYIGFDCTADSLHVGSLVQIMILRLLQKHGHKPIVLMGGGTTRIGDPSGKDESRQLLDRLRRSPRTCAESARCSRRFCEFGDGPSGASWSTTPTGWMSSATSRSCAMSACISRSTGC